MRVLFEIFLAGMKGKVSDYEGIKDSYLKRSKLNKARHIKKVLSGDSITSGYVRIIPEEKDGKLVLKYAPRGLDDPNNSILKMMEIIGLIKITKPKYKILVK